MTSGTLYWSDDAVTVWHGDCLDVMAAMPDNTIDAIVTDPPYGLEFMGKDWDKFGSGKQPGMSEIRFTDGFERLQRPSFTTAGNPHCRTCGRGKYDKARGRCECPLPDFADKQAEAMRGFQQWCEQWATQALRVLKPGGHMLAFGGTRTWHRLAVAIEDAGFELRDSIAWLYGSGFPKSLDVSKAIDKAAGAEREVVGTKLGQPGYHLVPGERGGEALGQGLNGHTAAERLAASQITAAATDAARQWQGWGTALKPAFEPVVVARKPLAGTVAANVQQFGTGALNVDGCRVGPPEDKRAAGTRRYIKGGKEPGAGGGGIESAPHDGLGRWPTNVVLDEATAADLDQQTGTLTSGAMRAGTRPKGERNTYGQDAASGYETQRDTYADSGGASRFFPTFRYEPKAPTDERPREGAAAHPTVKPLDLMRWLVRLVTPPGGLVLDPFAGSGTTAEACVIEGARCVTIEREAAYLPLIVARLSKPIQPDLFGLDA